VAITAFAPGKLSDSALPPESVIFGVSHHMQVVRERLEKIALANVPVLIEGESGTGKDIVARLIHQLSPWRDGPYVKINCPAIPDTLLESELFGHEKGAFTGATDSRPGRVEMANRGTLFLDEISELESGLQSKLLQLLQDGQFCRIGAQEEKKMEARVVCATNRVLEREIERGTFRQDLYYRINVLKVSMPALRDRPTDIPILANYFFHLYNEKYNCRARQLSPHALSQMQSYHWPGNIRQLENLIKRYVIVGSEEVLTSEMTTREERSFLDPNIQFDGPVHLKKITREAVRELEAKIILKVLEAHHWNRKQAARALRISYRALLYKMQNSGLASANRKDGSEESNESLSAD
jgi:two-component system, NtrC family, response regulator AtoC